MIESLSYRTIFRSSNLPGEGVTMNISKNNAMQIVTEMRSLINQNVNMIDEHGIIIASTDASRINTFHEGAYEIITKGLDELFIYDDHTYAGARKGMNLPLMLGERVVGVISLTGEYDEVFKFGRIVKKMTEILLLENYLEEQKEIDARIINRFLGDWVFSDMHTYSKDFIARGLNLGIDITMPRRVIVAEIAQLQKYQDSSEGQMIIDNVNKSARKIFDFNKNNIFMNTPSQMIGLIPDCDDSHALQLSENLNKAIFQEHKLRLYIGIDKRGLLPNKAFVNAQKALNACKSTQKGIMLYEDINIEIFADEVSPISKKDFINKIFSGLTEREISDLIPMLKIYFDNNGSLNETSDKLFIHKNTLQYKLKKLAEQTGHDPRILTDAVLFYLALHFYESL